MSCWSIPGLQSELQITCDWERLGRCFLKHSAEEVGIIVECTALRAVCAKLTGLGCEGEESDERCG